MSRRFVNQLGHQESVAEVYLASNKQLRTNRNGNYYLSVDLTDRTGMVSALLWNANESLYNSFDNGDYVRVQGVSQLYQGGLQIIAKELAKVPAAEVDEEDYIKLGTKHIDRLAQRVSEILRKIQNVHLRNLAECFLMDEEFMARFTTAPAGIKTHHAYHGGLLEHVANLMEVILLIRDRYPQVDSELLLVGAFLHDSGKVEELTFDRDLAYSDEGQMIGHMVIACGMLDRKIVEAEKLSGEPFPNELAMRIKHMIISHHGRYEYGSPKLPMTIEAVALHHLDNLDAKINTFEKLIDADPNSDSPWTTYHPNLGVKLYKGKSPSTPQ